MTYLFFDIECANSFGGIGKMCSFGYVLCNCIQNGDNVFDFSIIEMADILMNPNAPFDWYLFKKGSKCQLTYSRTKYQQQAKFPHFYSKISSLLSAEDRLVFGFGCKNDVATIVNECTRYDLPQIEFSCYDIHTICEKFYKMQGGLSTFVKKLRINTQGMEFHDSRADAYFTMKVAEKFAKDAKLPLADTLKPYTPYTNKNVLQEQIKKFFKKWLERNTAENGENEKVNLTSKKIIVPEQFDWKQEFLQQITLGNEKNQTFSK